MIKSGNRVRIDREKLQNIIKNNNMSNIDFSKSLGRDGSYINKVIRDETYLMSMTDYLLIKSLYGVDIEYKEPVKEEIKIENNDIKTVKDLTPDELSKLIYKAVFGAVKHAWEDDNTILKEQENE